MTTRTLFALAILLAMPALGACQEAPTREAPAPAGAQPAPPQAPVPRQAPVPPAAGRDLRGCALLSEAEAAEIAGRPMRRISSPTASGCSMDSVPPNLTIEFMALTRTAVFDEIARHPSSEPLDGIGDGAFFVAVEGRTLAQLHIASGERMLISTLHLDTEGPDLKELAERLGRIVGPRLGE